MSETMRRPETPPAMPFFQEQQRPTLGDRRWCMRLGDLELELDGLDDQHHDILQQRYRAYVVPQAGAEAIRLTVQREPTDYFTDPPETFELVRVRLAADHDRIRYVSYRIAAWFSWVERRGQILLTDGTWEPVNRSLENVIRTIVAWGAIGRGGALVHGASAVWGGQGYLFYGESGAGKSTLSAVNRRATVVSDDLSLLLPGSSGALELVGSPFRGTYEEGEPVVGRFPLRAGFRLVKAAEAAVKDVPRVVAFSGLVANLPFVAETFAERPELFAQVQQAFDGIPLGHLEFRKDDSYWDAIAAAGLGPRSTDAPGD